MSTNFLTLTLLVLVACTKLEASVKRKFKLYNGTPISTWEENPFKFIVLLAGGAYCTGSIYGSNIVLSAGHCFMFVAKPNMIVLNRLRAYDVNNPTVPIGAAFIPEVLKFANAQDISMSGDDIAVVLLKQLTDFSTYDHTELKITFVDVAIGTVVTLAGYGLDKTVTPNTVTFLEAGNAEIAACWSNNQDERICAETNINFGYQKYVFGDSGAPLLIEENGEYKSRGVQSAFTDSSDGKSQMIFASFRNATIAACWSNTQDERICAEPDSNFGNQKYVVDDSVAPLLIKENVEYMSRGVLSDVTYRSKRKIQMKFAPFQ